MNPRGLFVKVLALKADQRPTASGPLFFAPNICFFLPPGVESAMLTFQEFSDLAQKGNLIPVTEKLAADMETTVTVLARLQ